MFIKLAAKNILADKKRTLVTILLITLTTAMQVFGSAFMDGSHGKMLENAVEIYPSYLQITNKDFRQTPSFDNLIFDVSSLNKKLANIPGIEVFSSRFESFVLFAAEEKAVGGMLAAIDPTQEEKISRLKESLKEGEYLSNTDQNQVYIGNELAKRLHLSIGDQFSFIGTGADYSFAADLLTVKGIFQTGLFDFDARSAFINASYFSEIMTADNMATHIIVLPKETDDAEILATTITKQLGDQFQSASWQQFMSGLVQAMKLDSIFGYITMGIIFIVIFFVIMIYTLLNIYGRVREIGVLRALGTSGRQILQMLILESAMLALISVVIGGLIGGLLAWYFNLHPIMLSGYEDQFKQYGLAASALPCAFEPLTIFRDMIIMFALAVSSTLYPIIKINSMRPIEAIHHV